MKLWLLQHLFQTSSFFQSYNKNRKSNVLDINATLNTNYVKTMARILVCGTGLNASYDYSNLFGRLNWGGEAEAEFRKYSVGNGVCNYRHVFAIYYEDVNKTQGYVSNSYGYK